jgi:hypothetical protein
MPVMTNSGLTVLSPPDFVLTIVNNTLRQCVARLVRDALSFSKKLANHIGAINLFFCHYNRTRAAA